MERAERLAREAVTIVDDTDALNQRADVRLVVADVSRRCGKPTEATAATADALRLFEEKGKRHRRRPYSRRAAGGGDFLTD